MRFTRIAVTMVAAFALSGCGTLTSFLDGFNTTDTAPAPVSSSASEEAAIVGQVVYIETVKPLTNDEAKTRTTTSADQLLDVRTDNGALRTVIQETLGGVRVGDRVRLAEGRAYRY
ncbi:hypothetical protein [Usitatibacter palustris]|uniref:Uncharacterized protein n=1 Tax=Usitatibacter palustris TaxID=2732487 RepID=A0A6M4H1X8_9PROT|nr:hypothetical protein [Usitatibacter palustris]QJR13460.1 hypothetical protein DSM104440_00244 [Usitatibacter palustris]